MCWRRSACLPGNRWRAGSHWQTANLVQALGQPELRLRGILVVLQRLLNVEGYQVVAIDDATGTIELNRSLLAKQFQFLS